MYIIRATMILAATLGCVNMVSADNTDVLDIVEHITADSVNEIFQPAALNQRLQFDDNPVQEKDNRGVKGRIGFRVQVFSDNNSRTAKNEAKAKERRLLARFPQYRSYVMFTAPYWRLRVGDFRSQQEAEAAADDIRKAFPSFSKEIRVVQDKINL